MTDINNIEQNKKRKINQNQNEFVLNNINCQYYKFINPEELIIIDSPNNYLYDLLKTIIDGGTKLNIKKIITSDSVIIKYFGHIGEQFKILFPNCSCLQINSLENNFVSISQIIDKLTIIRTIEYIFNDFIFFSNSIIKYKYFTEAFFTCYLSNIKHIKIINKITFTPICRVENNIITSIINWNLIEKKNQLTLNEIKNLNFKSTSINSIFLEYFDSKNNIYINTNVINIM